MVAVSRLEKTSWDIYTHLNVTATIMTIASKALD